jgi:hypothetical protein
LCRGAWRRDAVVAVQSGEQTFGVPSQLPGEVHPVPDAAHRAFWVAEPLVYASREIVGTVGLRIVGDSHTRDGDTAESCGLLISISATDGLRSLVLNTTSAQLPALALYAGLGFREIGRSYLDVYELVWMQMWLAGG